MAINDATIESAEITYCLERIGNFRDDYGYGRKPVRQLPWAFVRFGGAGEDRKYVMPIPPNVAMMGSGINDALVGLTVSVTSQPLHFTYGRAFIEYMPNQPFPFENSTGPRSNGDPAGDVAVHFFGGV